MSIHVVDVCQWCNGKTLKLKEYLTLNPALSQTSLLQVFSLHCILPVSSQGVHMWPLGQCPSVGFSAGVKDSVCSMWQCTQLTGAETGGDSGEADTYWQDSERVFLPDHYKAWIIFSDSKSVGGHLLEVISSNLPANRRQKAKPHGAESLYLCLNSSVAPTGMCFLPPAMSKCLGSQVTESELNI